MDEKDVIMSPPNCKELFMEHSLKNAYISVQSGSAASYGGNQMLLENKTERTVGCGVIAALDLLLYLSRCHESASARMLIQQAPEDPILLPDYLTLVRFLRKRYIPLIPGHGINGLTLALGINACFLHYRLPYVAFWGVSYTRLWTAIRDMLDQDIPVIFSIGPNFPLFWQHHKLRFYTKTADGAYRHGAQTHAHYVMITGLDEEWLRISSWGKLYYIRREEYLAYVREHSARLVSNIMLIKKRGRGEP